MKRFKLSRLGALAITILISVSVMLMHWLILPVLPTTSKQQSAIFDEVWQTVNDNFYDASFNGVDWRAMQTKYAPQVKQAQSMEQVATAINRMLGELKTSHTHYYTPLDPAYYQILGIFLPRIPDLQQQLKNVFPNGKIEYTDIGIFTKKINDKIFVSGILDGSPAASAGLMVGDEILSVDGRGFHPIQSFGGKANKKVTIKIQRSANPSSQKEIVVLPKVFDAITMFLDAMKASTRTIERSGKKIGYVHVWSYAGEQYQEQLEEDLFFDRLKDADALVLDLREGWGGAPLRSLNIYTARGPTVLSIRRDGKQFTDVAHWDKPVVMLVNEASRSAKEILAYSFQQYDIGAVIGTKTAGAVVGGRPFLMQDGSVLYLAVADVYVDGDLRLEGKGITPDIVVPFTLEYAQGADPQKERAIEVALEAVKQREYSNTK